MGKDWKQWAKDGGMKKWFSRENLLILVLGGILLFIIGLPIEEAEETAGADSGLKVQNGLLSASGLGNESAAGTADSVYGSAGGASDENQEYVRDLEERLTDILSKMADVGKVQVLITLKSSEELIVEKEQPVTRSSTNENDSQGGSRVVSEMSSEENTVYRSDGSSSEPYVVKTLTPEIEGVLVVAEGAGSGTVSRTIVEIVQTLFGVDAHKVKVVKMEKEG